MIGRRRWHIYTFLAVTVAGRSSLAFVLAPRCSVRQLLTTTAAISSSESHPHETCTTRHMKPARRPCCCIHFAATPAHCSRVSSPLRAGAAGEESKPPPDGDDEGEELWGMADFLARKAERESQSGITPAAAEYLARGLPAGDVASLKAAIAEEKKRMKETKGKGEEEENAKESEGLPEFNTRTAERERASAGAPAAPGGDGGGGGAGLGLDGGIFPSDVSPSKVDADITMRPAKLDPGQPEAMVGFWQLYGATGNREDVSARIILRADGQVVGGPAVRITPEVKWSDEEGLRPVGGRWAVYADEQTGRARLQFSIVLSFQKQQQLDMDGVVMMVDAWDDTLGRSMLQPQVFGSVEKVSGESVMVGKPGDFSMMKTVKGEDDVFVATVGSQKQRLW